MRLDGELPAQAFLVRSWSSARAAYPQGRSANANSLRSQNSAGFPQICAIFQRDNLRRHFRVRVLHGQPRSRVSVAHVRHLSERATVLWRDRAATSPAYLVAAVVPWLLTMTAISVFDLT